MAPGSPSGLIGALPIAARMSTRESLAQARDDLARAREEAKARFNEWAVLLAKEAAESALVVVIEDEGLERPATEALAGLVAAAFGDVPADTPVLVDAKRIDALHDPAQVDLETASRAEREGGKADYVDDDEAAEAIACAERIVDACQGTLDA